MYHTWKNNPPFCVANGNIEGCTPEPRSNIEVQIIGISGSKFRNLDMYL